MGLSILGVAFIYSAQYYTTHATPVEFSLGSLLRHEWFRQIVYLGLGTVIYVAVSLVD